MRKQQRSVIEAIGKTPLVELVRFGSELEGRILAKLEYLNPGASKKDRIALQMIEDAEADGRLAPSQTVVELTSGNTGTGLAIVCAVKGYPFVAVMSEGNSVERSRMMRALGAEVVLVAQTEGSVKGQVSGEDLALVESATVRLVEERGAFRADQFRLESNFRAHYLHTGPEILAQAECTIDVFCDFAGTGGTFGGCAAAFKEANPATRCYVVEPEKPQHQIQGGDMAWICGHKSGRAMWMGCCAWGTKKPSSAHGAWLGGREFLRATRRVRIWRRRRDYCEESIAGQRAWS